MGGNMVRHTRKPQLALLLPLAISQGWSVRKFATTAQIDTNEAGRLLKEASRNAITALGELESVDALTLTVRVGNEDVTLGTIQGKMVTGAARSLATLPENPHEWTDSNDRTYRRCQTILRDAKAMGLIRFGEAEKGGISPAMRAIDPFLSQETPVKRVETENSPLESGGVNDGVDSSHPAPVDSSTVQGEGGE